MSSHEQAIRAQGRQDLTPTPAHPQVVARESRDDASTDHSTTINWNSIQQGLNAAEALVQRAADDCSPVDVRGIIAKHTGAAAVDEPIVPRPTDAGSDNDVTQFGLPTLFVNEPAQHTPAAFAEQLHTIDETGNIRRPERPAVSGEGRVEAETLASAGSREQLADLQPPASPSHRTMMAAGQSFPIAPTVSGTAAASSDPAHALRRLAASTLGAAFNTSAPAAAHGPSGPPEFAVAAVTGDERAIQPRKTRAAKAVTAFESVVLQNLKDDLLRSQYVAMWEQIQQGLGGRRTVSATIVSCEPEKHTSDSVAHLAHTLAMEMGKRVLIVDGNLTAQTLSKFYHLQGKVGLLDVCSAAVEWISVVTPTANEKISMISAGSATAVHDIDASNLMTLMTEYNEEFDCILVDGGPLDSRLALPLCHASDGAYLLVRLGQTSRELIAKVRKMLKETGVSLQGCIISNVPVT